MQWDGLGWVHTHTVSASAKTYSSPSLALLVQPALGPQSLAVGRDKVYPVLEILWDIRAFHLKHKQIQD